MNCWHARREYISKHFVYFWCSHLSNLWKRPKNNAHIDNSKWVLFTQSTFQSVAADANNPSGAPQPIQYSTLNFKITSPFSNFKRWPEICSYWEIITKKDDQKESWTLFILRESLNADFKVSVVPRAPQPIKYSSLNLKFKSIFSNFKNDQKKSWTLLILRDYHSMHISKCWWCQNPHNQSNIQP